MAITNVWVACEDAESVTVSGKLGTKYTFQGRVMLGPNGRLRTRDFKIVPRNNPSNEGGK